MRRRRLTHGHLKRLEVVDLDGRVVGRVRDTWPQDGGGEPELVLVAVGERFPRLRWLPLAGADVGPTVVRVPFARPEIDDAPSADDRRWGDPAQIARAHWGAWCN